MALTDTAAREAAGMIFTCWRTGTRIPALPESCRPITRAEGYAIQSHLEHAGEGDLIGWKIAATSAAGQHHIGVDGPLAGRLLAKHNHPPGAILPWGHNTMRVAEAEFAFRMAHPLPPRATPYSVAETLSAVATLHPAIEIPDSRFTDFAGVGAAQLIADNACAHDFVLGPATTADWRALDLAEHRATGTVTGHPSREGFGRNVLGDPCLALTWLANELSAHGLTLRAGDIVTTGTCLVPLEIAPGDEVAMDFGILGGLSIRFAAS